MESFLDDSLVLSNDFGAQDGQEFEVQDIANFYDQSENNLNIEDAEDFGLYEEGEIGAQNGEEDAKKQRKWPKIVWAGLVVAATGVAIAMLLQEQKADREKLASGNLGGQTQDTNKNPEAPSGGAGVEQVEDEYGERDAQSSKVELESKNEKPVTEAKGVPPQPQASTPQPRILTPQPQIQDPTPQDPTPKPQEETPKPELKPEEKKPEEKNKTPEELDWKSSDELGIHKGLSKSMQWMAQAIERSLGWELGTIKGMIVESDQNNEILVNYGRGKSILKRKVDGFYQVVKNELVHSA